MNKKRTRCDAVVVQLIVTTYDEFDRPIGEQTSQAVKVFRAGARDFWAEADKAVAQLTAPPPAEPKGKKPKQP